jgi:hypothetical protein
MIKRAFLPVLIYFVTLSLCDAQIFIKTSDLFPKNRPDSKGGELNISQNLALDTLMNRYILGNRQLNGGMDGFRIQIYRSSNRNAREESNKVRAEFMVEFPDIPSYIEYAEPGYFIVRVGDFRSQIEGAKSLSIVKKKFPNAYQVHDIINFPDQDKN